MAVGHLHNAGVDSSQHPPKSVPVGRAADSQITSQKVVCKERVELLIELFGRCFKNSFRHVYIVLQYCRKGERSHHASQKRNVLFTSWWNRSGREVTRNIRVIEHEEKCKQATQEAGDACQWQCSKAPCKRRRGGGVGETGGIMQFPVVCMWLVSLSESHTGWRCSLCIVNLSGLMLAGQLWLSCLVSLDVGINFSQYVLQNASPWVCNSSMCYGYQLSWTQPFAQGVKAWKYA